MTIYNAHMWHICLFRMGEDSKSQLKTDCAMSTIHYSIYYSASDKYH